MIQTFAGWRSSVAVQQLYRRYADGSSKDERMKNLGALVPQIAKRAEAVLDHAGYPEAGIAVTFPADTDDAAAARIAARVVAAAAGISRRIRGLPAGPASAARAAR